MSLVTMGMGDDGSGLEVAVVLKTQKIPILALKTEKIAVDTAMKKIKVTTSEPLIGVNLEPKDIEIKIKD